MNVWTRCKFSSKWMLEHPSGGIPRAAKGTLNVAFSDAIIPSQSVADVTQAPIAGPLAAIRIGYKYDQINSTLFQTLAEFLFT